MDLPIVDTHQHLWDPARFAYSWLTDFPTLNVRAMLDEYRAAAGANIVQTVYVDTDVDERDLADEIEVMFALADDPANRLAGIVAGVKLEQPGFFDHLEKFAGHPKLKGLRRVLHTQPDELSQSPQFLQNLQTLPARGLSFDLCVLARQLPLARKLVADHPDVSFILDHCGCPDIKGHALDPWRADIAALAQLPNVVCKVSGIVAYADPVNWTPDDLRPFVDHVIACFGWDRVLWGGDWPVCTLSASLSQWAEAAQTLVAHATRAQQEQFFALNAQRIYRLDPIS